MPDCFRDEFKEFVDDNLLPERDGEKTLVKYYAKVVKTSEKTKSRIGALNKFHIWTREHVVSHMDNKKPYVWLLRVYKLDKPIMLKRSKGMVWATVNEEVELKGKSEYIFINVLEYISFDVTNAHGRSIVTTINKEECGYHDTIKDGDELEIFWE